jgi:hypothetical protein
MSPSPAPHLLTLGGHMAKRVYITRPIAERFWEKVGPPDASGCRMWTAAGTWGYGTFYARTVGNRKIFVRAHRMAWELTHGPIPEGLQVLHRCDQPACCAPSHLFLGTNSDNRADSVAKDRHGRLKRNDVVEIKRAIAAGEDCLAIAVRYSVTRTSIYAIKHGRHWSKVV